MHLCEMQDFWDGVWFIHDIGGGRPGWRLKDGRLITPAQMLKRERLFKAGHDPDSDYVPDLDATDATLGPIVLEERIMRNMSQRELASVAGVSQSMVARLERGMREPSWRTFRLLLEAMKLVPVIDVRDVDGDHDAESDGEAEPGSEEEPDGEEARA